MDVKQMNYILAIARAGGISKAAKQLFITQSALDQQLLKLEKELGTQLFARSRSHVALTPAGKVYVDYAQRIVALKDEAYRIIHDMAERQRGTLSLAFAPERGMEMFVDVYPQFYQAYPEIGVIPQEMQVEQQLVMLQEDKLDLGFISHSEKELPGLSCIPLLREEFLLIVPLSHPLARQAAPEGEPLATLPLSCLRDLAFSLIYRQSTQREVIDPLFQRQGLQPALFMETGSNRANISVVRNGLCCSIVPYYYVGEDRTVARFRLEGKPSWWVSVCSRRGHYLTKAAQHFIRLAQEYYDAQQAGEAAQQAASVLDGL